MNISLLLHNTMSQQNLFDTDSEEEMMEER